MQITDLFNKKKRVFSFEVFPPKKTSSEETIYNALSGMRNLPCDFISVTYGAGGSSVQKHKTIEMCSLIKKEYGIEPLMHLTCVGCSRSEIDDVLSELKRLEISNILALRGDLPEGYSGTPDFPHASDLATYIKKYDSSFSVSGACYPEGHPESENFDFDIEMLKKKVDSGVKHLVTQLFFDNDKFFRFLEKLSDAGINASVEAGIMPITKVSQIERTVSMCGAAIPPEFAKMLARYSDNAQDLVKAGTEYAVRQIEALYDGGAKGIHLYTMNNVETAKNVSEALSGKYI